MKIKAMLTLCIIAFIAGCASPSSQYGKKKVNFLGGLVTFEEGAYARRGPLTISEKSSTVNPKAQLKGGTVKLFWGAVVYVDE